MTLSGDEQRFLDDFFAQHPEAKEQFDRRRAMEQSRQQEFDAIDLPELRAAAVSSLISAADVLLTAGQDAPKPSSEWMVENRKDLASYLLAMVETIDDEGPGVINLAKWFDFFSVEEAGHGGLQTVVYEAVAVYNAYLRRKGGLT